MMGRKRSQIIWVPNNGSGKVRTFSIHPGLLRILFFVVFLSIGTIPVLETGLYRLVDRIHSLEEKKDALHEENASLHYLKMKLVPIEEKERRLKEYFGMEGHKSLDQIAGSGGTFGIDLSHMKSPDSEEKHYRQLMPGRKGLPGKLKILSSNYETLNQLSAQKAENWRYIPNIVPVELTNPRISSGFGWRKNPLTGKNEFHAGIDILGSKDTKIITPSDGLVITIGYDRWLGNYIVIQHNNEIRTIYGHLQKTLVKKGIMVKRGDHIAIMGNTGMSTNTHLHYAVINNDRPVNPMQYILDIKG